MEQLQFGDTPKEHGEGLQGAFIHRSRFVGAEDVSREGEKRCCKEGRRSQDGGSDPIFRDGDSAVGLHTPPASGSGTMPRYGAKVSQSFVRR